MAKKGTRTKKETKDTTINVDALVEAKKTTGTDFQAYIRDCIKAGKVLQNMKFALQDFITGAIDRMVMKSRADGKEGYTNARITFLPGETYETHDELLIRYIKGEVGDCRQKSIATTALIDDLKRNGIEYEVKKCGTCSNAKPKAFYNPFKIVEEQCNAR